LIFQRHVAVQSQLINQPRFLVWKEHATGISFADTSVLQGEGLGRKKRRKAKATGRQKKEAEDISE
jgi:ribosomal protein S4